jgi:CubicO group peptidase (beta-lactamase class C family)
VTDSKTKTLGLGAVLCLLTASNEEFVARLAKLPLAYQPGTTWDCSHATDVLGRVIEVVAGTPGPYSLPGTGFGFGLGFGVRKEAGVANVAGSVGEYNWGGAGGTYYWADPKEDMSSSA